MIRPAVLACAVLAALGVSCSSSAPTATRTNAASSAQLAKPDALPSWNDGPAKAAIQRFVVNVTYPGADYVPPGERIAVFDNDGTLWPEQPVYTQLKFTADCARDIVSRHPEQQAEQPFKSLIANDWKSLAAQGEVGMQQVLAAAYAGMTTREFDAIVTRWIDTTRDPRFNRLYPELSYQPMLELIDYLRDNGFKIFIVSGGGVDFMRPWTERVYGVPHEQVVGSRIKLTYENESSPDLRRLPEIDFIDDRGGKPVGIQQVIGRRPIAAFGNSDGDFEMLEWTTSAPGARLGLIVHHTDAVREWAYDRESHVGKLSHALDEAPSRAWTVVDMKRDWRTVYAFQK
jgi:phosphoglycolate phosphatase-like HAD superfamily hydrolase